MKLLYVIPRMTYGGGMPTVISEVKHLCLAAIDVTATVVTLESNLSVEMMKEAVAIGLKVLLVPSESLLSKLISNADLTVVFYWNCPSMYRFFRFLADSQVPHRLCLSIRVNGATLPQVVPDWVYASCDALIQLHPRTPAKGLRSTVEQKTIPGFIRLPAQSAPMAIPDFSSFRLFHAGTLNYFKTHPDLISFHEDLQINQYQFDIWGSGMDKTFDDDLKQAKSAMYRGFSKDIYIDIAPYHLLCNPQTALSYGSFDKIMWECQWVGKPVIVLKNSYIADHVLHDVNGLVADDAYTYRAILEKLAAQPNDYKRLAERTFQYTRTHYRLVDYVEETVSIYKRTSQKQPKIIDASSIPQQPEEAALDGMGDWKQTLLTEPQLLSSFELNYALRCEGGLIHYVKAYPDNPQLHELVTKLITLEQSLAE